VQIHGSEVELHRLASSLLAFQPYREWSILPNPEQLYTAVNSVTAIV
jgi:hypothetical protein